MLLFTAFFISFEFHHIPGKQARVMTTSLQNEGKEDHESCMAFTRSHPCAAKLDFNFDLWLQVYRVPWDLSPYFSTVQMCFKYYVMETTEHAEAKTLGFKLGELCSSPYISATLDKSFFHFGPMFMSFFIQLYFRTPIFYISDENSYFHWMLIEGRP